MLVELLNERGADAKLKNKVRVRAGTHFPSSLIFKSQNYKLINFTNYLIFSDS
jgi:hypothetical protein